jgi:serine/threonine protein phosphatase 1
MRTFVIGDIHGCYDELIKLIEKIGFTDDDLLISVGDIVDRGNQSKEVYEFFLNRPHTKVLVGNHERKHQNGILNYAQEIVKLQFGEIYEDFLKWIDTLDYYIETEDVIIVHAAFEHDMSVSEQIPEVLSGTTSGERYLEKKYGAESHWQDYYQGKKPVIYGHHVVGDYPKIMNNTYGIDTGCCHGGLLTAIELPGFIIHQVKAAKDYWKEEQKIWQLPVLKAKDWENMEFSQVEKQLQKLAYIEEDKVTAYLKTIKTSIEEAQLKIPVLQENLYKFTNELLTTDQENFNAVANSYPFSTYLFKCKAGNLTEEDLRKGLNTLAKIKNLSENIKTNQLHK